MEDNHVRILSPGHLQSSRLEDGRLGHQACDWRWEEKTCPLTKVATEEQNHLGSILWAKVEVDTLLCSSYSHNRWLHCRIPNCTIKMAEWAHSTKGTFFLKVPSNTTNVSHTPMWSKHTFSEELRSTHFFLHYNSKKVGDKEIFLCNCFLLLIFIMKESCADISIILPGRKLPNRWCDFSLTEPATGWEVSWGNGIYDTYANNIKSVTSNTVEAVGCTANITKSDYNSRHCSPRMPKHSTPWFFFCVQGDDKIGSDAFSWPQHRSALTSFQWEDIISAILPTVAWKCPELPRWECRHSI